MGSSYYSWLPHLLLFYLIPWDFSLLSLRLHQPFLVSCGLLSRITHQPAGSPATTSTQSVLATPLFIPGQNSLFCFSLPTPLLYRTRMDKNWRLSPYLSLWHASSGPGPLLASFWVKCHPNKAFSLKEASTRTQK